VTLQHNDLALDNNFTKPFKNIIKVIIQTHPPWQTVQQKRAVYGSSSLSKIENTHCHFTLPFVYKSAAGREFNLVWNSANATMERERLCHFYINGYNGHNII